MPLEEKMLTNLSILSPGPMSIVGRMRYDYIIHVHDYFVCTL